MKITILIMIIFFMITGLPVFSQPIDSIKSSPERHKKFDPAANAHKDIKDAISLAKKSNKRIILDVGGEWCPWCHRLDSLFILNKDLNDYLNKQYILVKVNVSKENKNEDVLSNYPKIEGYPHVFLLNKEGKLIHSQNTGDWEFPENSSVKGYYKEKVFNFLKKWAK